MTRNERIGGGALLNRSCFAMVIDEFNVARWRPSKTYFNILLGPFFCPWNRFRPRLVGG